MSQQSNAIIPVRVDEQTKQALKKYAESHNRKLSDFLRLAAKYVMENKIKL